MFFFNITYDWRQAIGLEKQDIAYERKARKLTMTSLASE